jgi:hypothetical protein
MFLTTEQLWIVTSACSIRSEGEAASHACSNSSQDRGDGFLQVGTAHEPRQETVMMSFSRRRPLTDEDCAMTGALATRTSE